MSRTPTSPAPVNAKDVSSSSGSTRWQHRDMWLVKPLCCSYVFAALKSLLLPVRDRGAVTHVQWHWALGLFKQGQYEILGAWQGEALFAQVASDLHQRGVEQIKALSGEGTAGFALRYPEAASWPPANEPRHALDARRRVAFEAATAMAERLQGSIARAIRRHGPFPDEAAAADFLVQRLQKADRRFWAA